MSVRRLEADEVGLLEPILGDYPFKPYRQYRAMSRKRQVEVLLAEVESTADNGDGAVLVAEGADGPAAAITVRGLPWDSDFFGVSMGRIDYFLRADEEDRAVLGELLEATIDHCRDRGIRHVSARADIRDTAAIAVLEDAGFHLMDALVTYLHNPRRQPVPEPVRQMGEIRHMVDDDREQILEIAAEAYRGFRGRFHKDPHLPDERCDELYVEWARKICSMEMADVVLVTDDGSGTIIGFLGYRRLEPVSTVGQVQIYGGGLGACRKDRPGAYAGLIRASLMWGRERDIVAEYQTQNYNFPTVRIYEAIDLQYVRADYTFHGWFGPGDG